MAERNLGVASDRRIEYRIGVNVGDVMPDGDDLLGDGVNIAARLESLCSPGGIILSDDAFRQVRDRLEITWEDGGEHKVKNILRPVQVWRWSTVNSQKTAVVEITDHDARPLHDKSSPWKIWMRQNMDVESATGRQDDHDCPSRLRCSMCGIGGTAGSRTRDGKIYAT